VAKHCSRRPLTKEFAECLGRALSATSCAADEYFEAGDCFDTGTGRKKSLIARKLRIAELALEAALDESKKNRYY
jgi:hypothetical protein